MVPAWSGLPSIRWTTSRPACPPRETTCQAPASAAPFRRRRRRRRRRGRDRPRDPRPRLRVGAAGGRGAAGSRPHRPGPEHAPGPTPPPDQQRRDLGHRGRRPAGVHRRHLHLAPEHHRGQHRPGEPVVPGLLQLPDGADRHRLAADLRRRRGHRRRGLARRHQAVRGRVLQHRQRRHKRKIASISPTTGAPVAGFTANASAQATALPPPTPPCTWVATSRP